MSDAKLVYELTLDQPNLPKGELVQIPGLGTFENGSTYDIDADQAYSFRTYHVRSVPFVDEETQAILGSSVELGPTLLQASKTMYGVEVATYGKQPKEGDN